MGGGNSTPATDEKKAEQKEKVSNDVEAKSEEPDEKSAPATAASAAAAASADEATVTKLQAMVRGKQARSRVKRVESCGDDDNMDAEMNRMQIKAEDYKGLLGSSAIKKTGTLKKHSALVFDCGTGETKAIFLTYETGADGLPGRVTVKETGKAPAVLSFLGAPDPVVIADTKPYKDLLKKAKKNGKEAPPINKYFMAKPEAVPDDYTITADDFVAWAAEQRDNNNAKTVIVGSSAWHRFAEQDFGKGKEANDLVNDLIKNGLVCKKLDNLEEALFEAASVAYAAAVLGVKQVDAVIGAGGGSVQYMHKMKNVIGLDCGWRLGKNAMEKEYQKKGRGKEAMEAALQVADDYVNHKNLTEQLEGRVGFEIVQETDRCPDKSCKEKLKGTVICISACYYAADAAGISNGNAEMKSISTADCIAKFEEKIKELEAAGREDPEKFFKEGLSMTLVNLKVNVKLYTSFFDPSTILIFKRNWALPGDTPFRTTWSAGWYLYFLQSLGVKFPGSSDVLKFLDELAEKAKAAVSKVAGTGLGKAATENLGMVLVSLEDVVVDVQDFAKKMGFQITPVLEQVTQRYGGKMEGKKFMIKGAKSMNRKLISKIVTLYQQHQTESSYSPNLEECIKGIRDALRYTIVFPNKVYTAAVKAVEDALVDGLDKEKFAFEGLAKGFYAKNYWETEDNRTTYMGVNSLVTLKPMHDPKTNDIIAMSDDFVFELQFHTPESFRLKENDSHLFYEHFRDPLITKGCVPPKHDNKYDASDEPNMIEGPEFKLKLYKAMKSMWNENDASGKPKKEGVLYTGVKYKKFKPDEDISGHTGRHTAVDESKWKAKEADGCFSRWRLTPKVSSKFEAKLLEQK